MPFFISCTARFREMMLVSLKAACSTVLVRPPRPISRAIFVASMRYMLAFFPARSRFILAGIVVEGLVVPAGETVDLFHVVLHNTG